MAPSIFHDLGQPRHGSGQRALLWIDFGVAFRTRVGAEARPKADFIFIWVMSPPLSFPEARFRFLFALFLNDRIDIHNPLLPASQISSL